MSSARAKRAEKAASLGLCPTCEHGHAGVQCALCPCTEGAPAGTPPLNSTGNLAFTHKLKCWAENFDAIVSLHKRAEVRAEDDRKFKAGDMLDLTRTDHDGKPTLPVTRVIVEVLHVERFAGPLELAGVREGEAGGKALPVVVLSLLHRFSKITEAP